MVGKLWTVGQRMMTLRKNLGWQWVSEHCCRAIVAAFCANGGIAADNGAFETWELLKWIVWLWFTTMHKTKSFLRFGIPINVSLTKPLSLRSWEQNSKVFLGCTVCQLSSILNISSHSKKSDPIKKKTCLVKSFLHLCYWRCVTQEKYVLNEVRIRGHIQLCLGRRRKKDVTAGQVGMRTLRSTSSTPCWGAGSERCEIPARWHSPVRLTGSRILVQHALSTDCSRTLR